MKHLAAVSIRVVWAVFLAISSIYCLLAYLPYTYFAFIKAPAYEWMTLLAVYHAHFFVAGVLALAAMAAWERTTHTNWYTWAVLGLCGIGLAVHPILKDVKNNNASLAFALCFLGLLALTAFLDTSRIAEESKEQRPVPVGYAIPVAFAATLALAYNLGVETARRGHGMSISPAQWAGLLVWTLAAHVTVAVVLVSVVNMATVFSARFRRPRLIRTLILAVTISALAFWTLVGLLSSAFSFDGVLAWVYAAVLVVSVAIFVLSLVLRSPVDEASLTKSRYRSSLLLLAVAVAVAFLAPRMIHKEQDWNGIVEETLAIAVWLVVAVSAHRLRRRTQSVSFPKFAAVVIVVAFAFASLRFTEILWAKPLGSTDDDISRYLEQYSTLDPSFQTAHTLLGLSRSDTCDDRCRIFRQHANIRQAPPVAGFDLVDNMQKSPGEHPNIFIWVIDSMRPDYLGAYNPRVDFSPNFDKFAKDSLVLRNAYTQYAGTTLSVPAIWAGAEVLHTHYPQPFDKINSLLKLARTDGYQVMVSRDTVLNDLLPKTAEITNIEHGENLWMHQEMCQSVSALNVALDERRDDSRPILFFSQPMNLHQFAINNQPRLPRNWSKPGFNSRVSHEVSQVDGCFAQFVSALKQRQMYDNSIIIVTSDHGDALGDFGRYSHSITIYPEVMRVPLLIHLPKEMKERVLYDPDGVKTLTDIAPTLYYLLGHRDIEANPLFGRPLLVNSQEEIAKYHRTEWFMASDAIAVFGILDNSGRSFYAAYDSPSRSYLYDLANDPQGTKDVLTPELKMSYDRRIIEHLNKVARFYGYRPGLGGFLSRN